MDVKTVPSPNGDPHVLPTFSPSTPTAFLP